MYLLKFRIKFSVILILIYSILLQPITDEIPFADK